MIKKKAASRIRLRGFLHVRFVGTHAEYDKIKNIRTI